jgi:carbonic anhydrase/acetyltransferase-like protein (isoleucine patch superfamily)
MIRTYSTLKPWIDPSAYIDASAQVIGDVEIGAESSIWPGCSLRGDMHHIRIGRRTNIQDLSVVHVTSGTFPTIVGDDVTVGHRVILHGCTIANRVLVGMGAIVMDDVEVPDDTFIAAGALVTPGTKIPGGVMVMGSPAKPRRDLTDAELAAIKSASQDYVDLAANYLAESR